YHTVVELLQPLIRGTPDGFPAVASDRKKSYILIDLAIALGELGRLDAAISLEQKAIQLNLRDENWGVLSIDLQNLATSFGSVNRLAASDRVHQLAQELASAAGDSEGVTRSLSHRMALAVDLGRFDEAELLHDTFRQRAELPRYAYRPGYCELTY